MYRVQKERLFLILTLMVGIRKVDQSSDPQEWVVKSRKEFKMFGTENNIKIYYPELKLCTDNAAMIGSAAYYEYINGIRDGLDLNAVPGLKLGQR